MSARAWRVRPWAGRARWPQHSAPMPQRGRGRPSDVCRLHPRSPTRSTGRRHATARRGVALRRPHAPAPRARAACGRGGRCRPCRRPGRRHPPGCRIGRVVHTLRTLTVHLWVVEAGNGRLRLGDVRPFTDPAPLDPVTAGPAVAAWPTPRACRESTQRGGRRSMAELARPKRRAWKQSLPDAGGWDRCLARPRLVAATSASANALSAAASIAKRALYDIPCKKTRRSNSGRWRRLEQRAPHPAVGVGGPRAMAPHIGAGGPFGRCDGNPGSAD